MAGEGAVGQADGKRREESTVWRNMNANLTRKIARLGLLFLHSVRHQFPGDVRVRRREWFDQLFDLGALLYSFLEFKLRPPGSSIEPYLLGVDDLQGIRQ